MNPTIGQYILGGLGLLIMIYLGVRLATKAYYKSKLESQTSQPKEM